jgi:hypothetical protein
LPTATNDQKARIDGPISRDPWWPGKSEQSLKFVEGQSSPMAVRGLDLTGDLSVLLVLLVSQRKWLCHLLNFSLSSLDHPYELKYWQTTVCQDSVDTLNFVCIRLVAVQIPRKMSQSMILRSQTSLKFFCVFRCPTP